MGREVREAECTGHQAGLEVRHVACLLELDMSPGPRTRGPVRAPASLCTAAWRTNVLARHSGASGYVVCSHRVSRRCEQSGIARWRPSTLPARAAYEHHTLKPADPGRRLRRAPTKTETSMARLIHLVAACTGLAALTLTACGGGSDSL